MAAQRFDDERVGDRTGGVVLVAGGGDLGDEPEVSIRRTAATQVRLVAAESLPQLAYVMGPQRQGCVEVDMVELEEACVGRRFRHRGGGQTRGRFGQLAMTDEQEGALQAQVAERLSPASAGVAGK